jgi:predicted P-loop ATPase
MGATINIYKNIHDVKSNQTVHLDLFLNGIQEGKWQDQIINLRRIANHDERQMAKKTLPYVTISGFFAEKRSANTLSKHSGFIGMDIDNLGGEVEGVKKILSSDPYVYACFASASGTGLCAIFKIDGERHADAFDGLASYLLNQHQLVVDQSGKDVSRPRYVSYDPFVHFNHNAPIFKKYLPKKKAQKLQSVIYVQDEFDRIINEMVDRNVSCVEDYRDWITVGFALADKFGESGRGYYHTLSSISAKYESSICDRQYTLCLRDNGTGRKATIATIYYYAKQSGIEIYSQKVKKVAAATSAMKKSGLDQKTITGNLAKFEGITDADEIIKQAFEGANDYTKGENIVDNIRMWLRHNYELKRNLVTRKIENQGNPLDEIDINSMFLDCKVQFDDANFDLFCKVLFSNNTPTYNPIMEWFKENEHIRPTGAIDAFFGSVKTNGKLCYFGTKWLIGVISAAHGIHSPLMLILSGQRQGTGKTEFFRRMLPDALKKYYAESKLDAGKDDEILMTQKLLIMDDEMGGKSKAESKRLKELTSKQTFTLREPYGRVNVDLNRLAVLCGTTNDIEILNDPTGNRRLLPFEIESIDFEKYNEVSKTELLMEAYHYFKAGVNWELTSEDVKVLETITGEFQESSLERELLHLHIEPALVGFMSTTQIKNHLETHSVQKLNIRKLGMELRRAKYERAKMGGFYGYKACPVSIANG